MNSNIYILRFGFGFGWKGGLPMVGAPNMHSIYGLRHAGHSHLGRSHDGMVFSQVQSLNLPKLVSGKHLVAGWARSVLAKACVALLCRLVHRLFVCLFFQ